MSCLNKRLQFLKEAISRPIPKYGLFLWAFIGTWDTFASQFLPKEVAEKFPNFYQFVIVTSGVAPFWVWLLVGLSLISIISIEYSYRRSEINHKIDSILELSFKGEILRVTARHLWGFWGPTRYALCFSWSSDRSRVFDEIEGHHPTIYHYDFDGDDIPEIIVKFHCGAHTHVMRVYKIFDPPSPPRLIPGANIGSDFPEIKWETRKNGEGVVIYAKNRNWEGGLVEGDPITGRYIFEDGYCINLPHDRIID